MTNNTNLIKLVYNGANPLAQKSEAVSGRAIQPETVVYFNQKGYFTCIRKQVESWQLDRPIEFPDACPLDLIVKPSWRDAIVQVEVNLSGELTEESIMYSRTGVREYMVGLGLAELGAVVVEGKEGKSRIEFNGTTLAFGEFGVYKLSAFALNQEPLVFAQVLKVAREIVEQSRGQKYSLVPVHPDWIEAKKNEARFNLILFKKVNDKSFTRIIFDRMGGFQTAADRAKAALRFGKDALAEFVGSVETKRILVLADKLCDGNKDLLSDDGIIFMRSMNGLDAGQNGLVRGVFMNADGHTGIVKGRVVANAAIAAVHPDADALLMADVDGWSREGQFKFANVKAGDVITVRVGLTKYENYDEHDSYALNTAALYIADMTAESKTTLTRWLTRSAKKVAMTFSDMAGSINATFERGFEDEESSAIINGRMAKYMLGYTGSFTNPANDTWVRAIAQRASSVKDTHVLRAAANFAETIAFAETLDGVVSRTVVSVPVDGFLASDGFTACVDEFKGLPIMALRYPVLTKTSFLDVEFAGSIAGFAGRFVLMHPKAALYLAGDGDDHVNFAFGLKSNVKPSTDIPSIEKHCVEVALENVTAEAAYVWGHANQAMVGAYTNALHESVLFGADPNTGDAASIAQAVQALVQGVKKPVRPACSYAQAKHIVRGYRKSAKAKLNSDDFAWRDSMWDLTHKTAARLLKVAAIERVYRFDDITPSTPVARETITMDATERMLCATLYVKYFKAETAPAVTRLSRELIDTLVAYYSIDLATAEKKDFDRLAQVYAAFYDGVASAQQTMRTSVAFEHANGALLWWGHMVK